MHLLKVFESKPREAFLEARCGFAKEHLQTVLFKPNRSAAQLDHGLAHAASQRQACAIGVGKGPHQQATTSSLSNDKNSSHDLPAAVCAPRVSRLAWQALMGGIQVPDTPSQLLGHAIKALLGNAEVSPP